MGVFVNIMGVLDPIDFICLLMAQFINNLISLIEHWSTPICLGGSTTVHVTIGTAKQVKGTMGYTGYGMF